MATFALAVISNIPPHVSSLTLEMQTYDYLLLTGKEVRLQSPVSVADLSTNEKSSLSFDSSGRRVSVPANYSTC